MKLTYLLIGMAFIAPQASKAQEFVLEAKLLCNETTAVITALKKDFKEVPFLLGRAGDDSKSIMSLWINPTTKSWTILATKNDVTCVVGVGDKLELIPHKDTIKLGHQQS